MSNGRQHARVVSDKMQLIIKSVRSHLKMDIAFISDFAGGQRTIQYVDGDSRHAENLQGHADPLNESYCYLIAEGQLPEIIPDSSTKPVAKKLAVTDKLEIASYLATPLRDAEGSIYGMFCCIGHSINEGLNERDLALMEVFADMAGVEISEHLQARQAYDEIYSRIEEIMSPERLNIAYQPIYDPKGKKVVGYESLARFDTTPYRTPDIWFGEALQVGMAQELELLATLRAMEGVHRFDEDVYISLNVSPELILSGELEGLFTDDISHRIVLEITEHSQINDYEAFREAITPLRSHGVKLAVDDAGAGYASFQHVLELGADIIKLDISLIKGIDSDPARSALTRGLIAFARETDTQVVAEGVETREEFNELLKIGVDKIQGYYIGYPMPVEQAVNYHPQVD